jgi:multiple antibiotic resistance protein
VAQLLKFFGLSFSALVPLVNPLGDALLFLGLVGNAPHTVYRTLAKKIAINTTVLLLTVELIGTAILKFLGISLPVMQVAGGLVLAAMGWNLLNKEAPNPKLQRADMDPERLGSLERQSFYPFTFPITVGPGGIVVMVTLSAHASVKGLLPNIAAHAGSDPAMLRQHTSNGYMVLAEGTPNLMQRLSRLPAPPYVIPRETFVPLH